MQAARKTLYLIDASSYVYRAFHALPPLNSPDGTPTNAVYGVTTMLLKLLRDVQPEYLAAVFDARGPTFRDELYPAYKAQRPPMPEDLAVQFELLQDLIAAFAIPSIRTPGVEADDVIATLVRHFGKAEMNIVIVTGDKDLMQLVTPHVHLWDTMRNRRFDPAAVRARMGVEPNQVVELLGLMGDSVDNVPGVKGIGEKTATTLIGRFGSIDNLYRHLDELEQATDIRGAKKLAATLRSQEDGARLSRELVSLRDDVPIDTELETYRYHGPDTQQLRALFNRFGFQRLLNDITHAAPAASVEVTMIESMPQGGEWMAAIRATGTVALAADAEGLLLAVDADRVGAVSTGAAAEVESILHDEDVEKIAHDLKHDLSFLLARGADVPAPAFDVMIASYLLEASPTHRLEDLAADLLGITLAPYRESRTTLANGVAILPALRQHLAPKIEATGMRALFYELEMPLVPILARMERHGVLLDDAAFRTMSGDLQTRLDALTQEIFEAAGHTFNILSPTQLREVLFDELKLPTRGIRRGKTGLSTDVDVLEKLAAIHPLPAKVLEYRAVAKLKSTYVDALPAAVNPQTGRLHTRFNQTVAATGRLSSSDPNLQNIPIRGDDGRRIRAAFIAPPGHQLLSADYSQIELRLLAHLADDKGLQAAFQSNEDIHSRTAAEVFGGLPGMVSAEMRRRAKVINFGILYGMGAQSLARELGVSSKEAEEYIRQYFDRYAAVRRYLETSREEARERGYAVTLLGRRRTVSDLSSRDRGLIQAAERVAINTPIQGSAADVIKLAMVAIDRRIREEKLRATMILQVHDELLFEVAEADVERCRDLVREGMEGALSLAVPLKVEIGVGRNWAEAH